MGRLLAAVFKTFAAAGLVVMFAAGLAALAGWLVFEIFGAVTMIVVYVVAMALFLLTVAAMSTGRLATHYGSSHPVIVSIVSSGLLVLAILGASYQLLDVGLNYLAPAIIPFAALRAWYLTRNE